MALLPVSTTARNSALIRLLVCWLGPGLK